MTISKALADFTGVLDATRTELNELNVKIEGLEVERQRIALAPPHTDDIADVLMRGLRAASSEFTADLRGYLTGTFSGTTAAAAAGKDRSADILRVERNKPDAEALMTRQMRGQPLPNLNIAALAYFLRDRIETEIPALVEKLFPEAGNGMRQADRDRDLQAHDAELSRLRIERDQLQEALNTARQLVNGKR